MAKDKKETTEPTAEDPILKITHAQLQAMISEAVKTAVDKITTPEAIDDTGYWQAKCECQSEFFGCLPAGKVIKLDEAIERKLKLGKFAETIKDPNTGKDIAVTYAHLEKPSTYTIQRIIGLGDGQAVDDGILIMPSLTINQSLSEKMPFRLVSPAAAG